VLSFAPFVGKLVVNDQLSLKNAPIITSGFFDWLLVDGFRIDG